MQDRISRTTLPFIANRYCKVSMVPSRLEGSRFPPFARLSPLEQVYSGILYLLSFDYWLRMRLKVFESVKARDSIVQYFSYGSIHFFFFIVYSQLRFLSTSCFTTAESNSTVLLRVILARGRFQFSLTTLLILNDKQNTDICGNSRWRFALSIKYRNRC